ncbi:hypothetical protein ACVQMY_004577 [Escherichia coli]
MKMPVTTFSCWLTRPAALGATKKLKEKTKMKGKNGRTAERQAQKKPTDNRAFCVFLP